MKKLRVCILFGGKSGEHEVSLQSAKSIYEALDKAKYEVFLVGIDKEGRWLLEDAANYLLNAENPKLIALNRANAKPVTAITTEGGAELIALNPSTPPRRGSGNNDNRLGAIDVFFPITHGTYGEDGCLQGFLELLDAAYVGPGVLGSAVGMDKDVMKRLLRDAGLPIGRFFVTLRPRKASQRGGQAQGITEQGRSGNIEEFIKEVGFPIFVKPANLGSSVGISKAKDEDELRKAIEEAFLYDTKIILEEFIKGREIEVSVLGNENPEASLPGEVRSSHDFYSYEAKYIDEAGASYDIPARLSPEEISRVQGLACRAFQVLECFGMGRVDFFLRPTGEFVVNEINTLPGFTKISMYPKLWEATGVPYSELLERLIELALEKKREKDKLKRTFEP